MSEEAVGTSRDRRLRLRWDIWTRSFRFRLMPPRPVLHRLILERDALGTKLWGSAMRPALGSRIPAMFAADADPVMRRIAMDLRRVGASSYALTGSLYYLHGARPNVARSASVAAMWLTQAAAVIDYLLDEEAYEPAKLAAHLSPEFVSAALPPPGRARHSIHHFDAPPFDPELTFILVALERGFAGLRDCMALGSDDAYHRRLREELIACLQQMIGAELGSPALHMDRCDDLDAVERTLRRVNTLFVWLFAYAGLVAEPMPGRATLDAVDRAAQLVGDIGWTLDALEDVLPDLEKRVWNRAWLLLAETSYRHRPAEWQSLLARPERALDVLAGSTVIDRLFADIEHAMTEIGAHSMLPASASANLVAMCQLLVWSFLAPQAPRPPPPAESTTPEPPPAGGPTGVFFEDEAPSF